MKNATPLALVLYFAMIYGIFYFASKGWSAGE